MPTLLPSAIVSQSGLYGSLAALADDPASPDSEWLTVTEYVGAKWYVRPLGTNYGAEDGTSYATAWEGFAAVQWASIEPGDVLYVAGKSSGSPGLVIGASGEAGRSIVIASCETQYGASTDDPGTIWGGALVPTTGWAGPTNGVYSRSANIPNANMVADESLVVFEKVIDLAACEATDNSWWHTTTPSNTIYVNFGSGGLRILHYSIFTPVNVNENSYLTIRGLTLYQENSTAGVISVYKNSEDTVAPLGIRVTGCQIGLAPYYGILSAGNGTQLEVDHCTIFDCGAGVYHTNLQGGTFSIHDNEFYHTSNITLHPPFRDGVGDRCAIAIQGGMNSTSVVDNNIHDWHGEGINLYLASTRTMPAVQILRNIVEMDTTEADVSRMGIHLSGDNVADFGDGRAGTAVAYNTVSGCLFNTLQGGTFWGGLRTKITDPTDPDDRLYVHHNTFTNCAAAYHGNVGATVGNIAVNFRDNTVTDPESGRHFIYVENETDTSGLLFDYNTYNGSGTWRWDGSDVANFAAWQGIPQDANGTHEA